MPLPLHTIQCRAVAASIAFLVLRNADTWAAPFGMSDTNYAHPRFTATVFPGYVRADGRGGLIWTFVNGFNLDGANGKRLGGMVRTTEAGSLDPTFVLGHALRSCLGTVVQADGKVLVGATKVGDTATNGAPNNRVFRVLTNGVLDTSYASPVFEEPPRFMTLQPDGKLVVGAAGANPAGNGGIRQTVRLNADGSLDSSFHAPSLAGGVWGVFAPPVLDANGAIYLAGGFTNVNGAPRQGVARLFPNGDLDAGFQPNGHMFSLFVRGLLLQDDGKVVIGGRLLRNGDSTYYALLRLNQDGSVDPSFTLVPVSQINFFRTRLLRWSGGGKILAVAHSLARFNSDGSLDNSFVRLPLGKDLSASDPFVECFWFDVLGDGRIVVPNDLLSPSAPMFVGGQAVGGAFRLNSDGTFDPSFRPPAFEEENYPLDPVQQSDGRLLVCGTFERVADLPTRSIARLNTNGTLDGSFNLTVTNLLWGVKMAALPDNQAYALLSMGPSRLFATSNALVRLNADGALDPTFDASAGLAGSSGGFSDLLLQGNQPIISGSDAQAVLDGNPPARRFLPDGTVDPSFVASTNALGKVYRDQSGFLSSIVVGDLQILTVLSNGQILAAMTIGDYATTQFSYQLFRLNSNGSVDNTYTPPTLPPTGSFPSFPYVRDAFGEGQYLAITPIRLLTAAAMMPDGGLLLCGAFNQIGGTTRPGLARLLADGTFDSTFPAGSGPSIGGSLTRPARIDSIKVDSRGKIWVTGNFDRFNGVPANGVVRLNGDGTFDPSFVPQCSYYGVNDYLETRSSDVFLALDGSVILLGPYRQGAEIGPSALNRLLPYPPPSLKSLSYLPGLGFSVSFDLVNGQTYNLEVSSDLRNWQELSVLTGGVSPPMFSDSASASLSQRFYRLVVR